MGLEITTDKYQTRYPLRHAASVS